MALSMTGYGRGEARAQGIHVWVELKSVNHRFLEAVFNLPSGFWAWESRLKKQLQAVLQRGHVEVQVQVSAPVLYRKELVVDFALARNYQARLRSLGKALGLEGQPDIQWIAGLPEVIRWEERLLPVKAVGQLMEKALAGALRRLQAMRRVEGTRLSADIRNRLLQVRRFLAEIKSRVRSKAQLAHKNQRETMRQRLADKTDPEAKRAGADVFKAAPNNDVTEEVVRFDSHLGQFFKRLSFSRAVGRGMDFLIQEINREINTVSAKAMDVFIAQRAVSIKEELEKIREQVQNLE